VLSEAWDKSAEIRAIVLISGVVMVLIAAFIAGVFGLFFGLDGQSIFESIIVQCVTAAAIYPIWAGVFMVTLRRSLDLPSDLNLAFSYYPMFISLAVIGIVQSLATGVGMLLLILPGIYLAIALSLAIPLHVERGMAVGDSLLTSLKLVNAKFVNVFALALIAGLAMVVGFVTIIGWIWTVPWAAMVFAITYRQLAGSTLTA